MPQRREKFLRVCKNMKPGKASIYDADSGEIDKEEMLQCIKLLTGAIEVSFKEENDSDEENEDSSSDNKREKNDDYDDDEEDDEGKGEEEFEYKDGEVVEYIVRQVDNGGTTPLHLAVALGLRGVASFLLQHGMYGIDLIS
tara:strand:- start:446 stop:868 length:423 start_codon:yes stop_codon:yes gene_type:complete